MGITCVWDETYMVHYRHAANSTAWCAPSANAAVWPRLVWLAACRQDAEKAQLTRGPPHHLTPSPVLPHTSHFSSHFSHTHTVWLGEVRLALSDAGVSSLSDHMRGLVEVLQARASPNPEYQREELGRRRRKRGAQF